MNQDGENRFFETRHVEHALIIRLTDDVVGNHVDMTNELRRIVERKSPEKLVIDLSRLSFCSAEALNGLLFARKLVKGVDGRIKVCVSERVREMFRITKLDQVLEVGTSVEEVLAEWPRKSS